MRLKVYVAGPISIGDQKTNVLSAIDAAQELFVAGLDPYIPHLTWFWDARHPHAYEDWMAYDQRWLSVCHALVRIPGDSPGSDREVKYALANSIPVFFSAQEAIEALV